MDEKVFLLILGVFLIVNGVSMCLPFIWERWSAKKSEKERERSQRKEIILGVFTIRTYSDNSVVMTSPNQPPISMKQVDFLFYFDPPLNGEGCMLYRRVLVTEIRCGDRLVDYKLRFVQ